MITKLEKNLNLILSEKTNKIIPDNIKKGITILGVEGDYGAGDLDPITIELSEIAATYSASLPNADANYGTSDHLTVDGSNAWIYRGYLKYDIDKFIGENVEIIEAKLKFYMADIDWGDYASDSDAFVAAATSNWNEKTLTWNNQPSKPSYVDEQNTPSVSNPQRNTWRTIDVTNIVKRWFSGLGNTGLCLSAKNEGSYRHQWALYNRRKSGYATILTVKFQNKTHIDTLDATATSGDLLLGKTAYAINKKIIGTMPNNGVVNITPQTTAQQIPSGYTSGGTVSAVTSSIDENIIPSNIKKDIAILGVTGTLESLDTSDATATARDIVGDKTAYVNGEKVTGTLYATSGYSTGFAEDIRDESTGLGNSIKFSYNTPDLNILLNNTELTIPVLNTKLAEHLELTADKIVEGNTILDVVGTAKAGIDTSDATATANDIAEDATAYVKGEKITGNIFTIGQFSSWTTPTTFLSEDEQNVTFSSETGDSPILYRARKQS